MTNITNDHRFIGDRNRAIGRADADSPHWIVQLIPIALLTAFMLFAVINPMW